MFSLSPMFKMLVLENIFLKNMFSETCFFIELETYKMFPTCCNCDVCNGISQHCKVVETAAGMMFEDMLHSKKGRVELERVLCGFFMASRTAVVLTGSFSRILVE